MSTTATQFTHDPEFPIFTSAQFNEAVEESVRHFWDKESFTKDKADNFIKGNLGVSQLKSDPTVKQLIELSMKVALRSTFAGMADEGREPWIHVATGYIAMLITGVRIGLRLAALAAQNSTKSEHKANL